MNKRIHISDIFNTALTPENAREKGYEYIDDVILDNQKNSTKDLLTVIEENDFKLGVPSINEDAYYGIYIPVKLLNMKL